MQLSELGAQYGSHKSRAYNNRQQPKNKLILSRISVALKQKMRISNKFVLIIPKKTSQNCMNHLYSKRGAFKGIYCCFETETLTSFPCIFCYLSSLIMYRYIIIRRRRSYYL